MAALLSWGLALKMPVIVSSLLLDVRYREWRLHAAALYLLVLILGSVPGARQKLGELASGGVLHSLTYGVITLLLFAGFDFARVRKAGAAVLTVVCMGALDEYVQSFFPYRSATVHDWLVDIAASAITALALCLWWPEERAQSLV
ncbi:MAG: VanZ family protein [Pseudomonadota bacterium]